MSSKHPTYLSDTGRVYYTCSHCHCHITSHDKIISRAFQGRHGPAYLVTQVLNVSLGTKQDRMLMTGIHTVADISCAVCHAKLGWKYLRAIEKPQKYKEGRYIVEKARIAREVVWEDDDDDH